jgi:hypothetical protein
LPCLQAARLPCKGGLGAGRRGVAIIIRFNLALTHLGEHLTEATGLREVAGILAGTHFGIDAAENVGVQGDSHIFF